MKFNFFIILLVLFAFYLVIYSPAFATHSGGATHWSFLKDGADAEKLKFYYNTPSNTKMTITTDGKTGIGTISPLYKLSFTDSSTDAIGAPVIGLSNSINPKYSTGIGTSHVTGTGQSLHFYAGDSGTNGAPLTSSAVRMTIMADGKTGIGTNNPTSVLNILSNGSSGDQLKIESGQTRIPSIRFNGPWSVSNLTESYAMIRAFNDNGGPGVGAAASLRFFTSSGDPALLSEKMTILGDGKVGIGTVNPQRKLHIVGETEGPVPTFPSAAVGPRDFLVVENNSNSNMSFIAGIGSATAIRFIDSGSAVAPGYIQYNHGDDSLSFAVTAAERLRIDSSGRVGIGIISPTNPLTVDGTAQGSNDSPMILYTAQTNNVFSILPMTSETYLGNGVYYKDGVWVHDGGGITNEVFSFGSGGGRWYASNNSSASWNVANGITLWTQNGTLVGASSRKLKTNITPLDYDQILQKIDGLDISRWNYKSDLKTSHIGPMAEDFHKIFGVGSSDEYIGLLDQGGVSLAGVKALNEKLKLLQNENNDLKLKIENLEKRLERLERK